MSSQWREVAEKVRNWGKWGPNDQLGTLNYITPEKIARAAAMVRRGKVFPLSIPVDAYGPQGAHGFRRNRGESEVVIRRQEEDFSAIKDDRRLLGTGDKAESARQAALCKRG